MAPSLSASLSLACNAVNARASSPSAECSVLRSPSSRLSSSRMIYAANPSLACWSCPPFAPRVLSK
ncbi:unnamed protein product [Arabis nemorensis]|uniref:Uncharacterized protein n=1 Tax=Arabis nemorensis TaxID=586526 RepID=A0A565AU41_9BRAS|nr:unnamed protein product [Arabis nemorensis]